MPLRKSVLQGGERMVRVDESGKAASTVVPAIERLRRRVWPKSLLYTGRTHSDPRALPSTGPGHGTSPATRKYGAARHESALARSGLRGLFLHAKRSSSELGGKTLQFLRAAPPILWRLSVSCASSVYWKKRAPKPRPKQAASAAADASSSSALGRMANGERQQGPILRDRWRTSTARPRMSRSIRAHSACAAREAERAEIRRARDDAGDDSPIAAARSRIPDTCCTSAQTMYRALWLGLISAAGAASS